MKSNIKARITCLFISKATIMVNKLETIYFIISISDKQLSSFFISLILSFSFTYIFFFPCLFQFYFVVSEWHVRMYSFLPTYLGGTFSLLDISEQNFFPRWGGGGGVPVHPSAPPLHKCVVLILTVILILLGFKTLTGTIYLGSAQVAQATNPYGVFN